MGDKVVAAMRYPAILLLISVFAACTGNKHYSEPQAMMSVNDTFRLEYGNHLQVPEGIYLDTIQKMYPPGGNETIVLPRNTNTALAAADRAIVQEIYRRLKGTVMQAADDTGKEMPEWTQTIEPVNIYKSSGLLSYGFISTYSDPGAMRPCRTYISVNYDIGKQQLLQMNDYFNIRTQSDSALLSYIIYSAVGERENPYWQYNSFGSSFDFSIDADKLYFYFDQFSAGGNPCGLEGSAKKQYFLKLIKHEYQ